MGAGSAPGKDEGKRTMSEKKAKEDRKLKLVTEEADAKKVAEEMAASIRKMYETRDEKAINAKNHLVTQLDVTVDKYRTANGVMSALNTLRMVMGDKSRDISIEDEIGQAMDVAEDMAATTMNMADKARTMEPDDLGNLCEGFYDPDFANNGNLEDTMVTELMILQLCQNVGPDAQDIVDFLNQSDAEIEKARKDLIEHCKAHDLDVTEFFGE